MDKKLLKTEQAAAYLNISPSMLEKDRCREGRIPFVRIGGVVRYDIDQLNALLERNSYSGKGEEA